MKQNKKILIIRHAKSGWDNALLKDIERPLNGRGLRDAPMMAKRLLQHGISIDACITSPAVRAFTTARFFAEAYQLPVSNFIVVDQLYNASSEVFYDVIQNIPDGFNTIAIFSHNPGITYFANSVTDASVEHMPTCGIFSIESSIESWKDFSEKDNSFWFFDFPKNTTGSLVMK